MEQEQNDSTVVKVVAANPASQSAERAQPANGSREMPVFFMIGIAINAIMMLSFAVWFVSEWRKQNRKKAGGKRQ